MTAWRISSTLWSDTTPTVVAASHAGSGAITRSMGADDTAGFFGSGSSGIHVVSGAVSSGPLEGPLQTRTGLVALVL
jgi:hypothetical protein